ncbi:C-C motif chemokine 19-like [Phaenicophaeus curvirostris]|uniref:C-C motif chemokine 19-like n=1 Tax=Phaenicophaeus curvirostris TaxID=33595 RepID=UPI0037F0DD5E
MAYRNPPPSRFSITQPSAVGCLPGWTKMKAKCPAINRSGLGTSQQCVSCSLGLPCSASTAFTMALRLLLPLLLLAAVLFIAQAQGIGTSASDCCLKTSQRAISSNWVKSYRLQGPESGCMLRAVVLTTKKNRKICASIIDPDVQKLMEDLDKRVKKDKKKGQFPRPRSRSKRQRRQQV